MSSRWNVLTPFRRIAPIAGSQQSRFSILWEIFRFSHFVEKIAPFHFIIWTVALAIVLKLRKLFSLYKKFIGPSSGKGFKKEM